MSESVNRCHPTKGHPIMQNLNLGCPHIGWHQKYPCPEFVRPPVPFFIFLEYTHFYDIINAQLETEKGKP